MYISGGRDDKNQFALDLNFWLPLDYRDTYIQCTYIYMHIYSEMYALVNFLKISLILYLMSIYGPLQQHLLLPFWLINWDSVYLPQWGREHAYKDASHGKTVFIATFPCSHHPISAPILPLRKKNQCFVFSKLTVSPGRLTPALCMNGVTLKSHLNLIWSADPWASCHLRQPG